MKFINTTNRKVPLNGMQARQPHEVRDVKEDWMVMTLYRSRDIIPYSEYLESQKILTPDPSPSEKGEKYKKSIKTKDNTSDQPHATSV